MILKRNLSSAQKPWYFPKEMPGRGKVMREEQQLSSSRVGFGAQIRAHQEEPSLKEQHLSLCPGLAQVKQNPLPWDNLYILQEQQAICVSGKESQNSLR